MDKFNENRIIVDALEEQVHRFNLCGADKNGAIMAGHKELIAKYQGQTFADECREFAQRIREFQVLDGAGFSDDFLDQLADDCETIAARVEK